MRNQLWGAAAAAALWAAPAAAVNTEKHEIPYFGVGVEVLLTDSARSVDDGLGFQLSVGVPMQNPASAIELRYFDAGYDRSDGKPNYQTGLFVDYVRDFGPLGGAESLLGGIKPFASLGLGFVQEDVSADKHIHLGLAVGGGVLVPIGFNGWAVRLAGRVQPQANSESVTGEDYLLDYAVHLGLQIPMAWFYDRPVSAPEADCPLAVVHPDTGRRDCITDSDGDGVDDSIDECPGTAEGAGVDEHGCMRVRESVDSDNDGVPNGDDKCPGTRRGLQVDEDGCVVTQKAVIGGVTFELNAAKLTAEGQATLDGVAKTLTSQEDLSVEIAGHTDSIGSEAFNTMLSQQRADAVRARLIEKGVAAGRMTAVGYGELEPIAPNDTDEGRKANRRVEFRIRAD